MSGRFEFRPATLEDAEEMARTVAAGFDSFRDWAGPGWKPPPFAREAEGIREGLQRPSVWALLALDGGAVAGHVAFVQARERQPPRADIPGLAHLWQLFVRRPWWGTGLASHLNALAVEAAAARRYDRMRLHTPAGNARARAFYEREGWTTDGVPIPEPLLGMDLLEYRHPLG
jgi:GNAT superfamily N-acetyltransferase